jgi:hypothetical protein
MIGKSGKHYRAGYLARQAGDWPDGQATSDGNNDSQQMSDRQQPAKYDGSQNMCQSATMTAPQTTPMPLYDSPVSSGEISPVALPSGLNLREVKGHPYNNATEPCLIANMNAVNKASHLHLTPENLIPSRPEQQNPQPRNGALNYNWFVPGATEKDLPVRRYPSSIFNFLTGIGPSLHVPAPGNPENDPKNKKDYSIYNATTGPNGGLNFTTHIDHDYATWHTPIGAAIHNLVDVRDLGKHRKPCS